MSTGRDNEEEEKKKRKSATGPGCKLIYLLNTHRLVCSGAFLQVQNYHHALHHPLFEENSVLPRRLRGGGGVAGGRWGHLQVCPFPRDRKCDFVHANTFNIKSGLHSKLGRAFTLGAPAPERCCGGGGGRRVRVAQSNIGTDTIHNTHLSDHWFH